MYNVCAVRRSDRAYRINKCIIPSDLAVASHIAVFAYLHLAAPVLCLSSLL